MNKMQHVTNVPRFSLQLPGPDCGPLDLNFFKFNAACSRSTYSNMREVCGRYRLAPGHYAIIPSTFKPGEEGDFIVRTYSERPNNCKYVYTEVPHWCTCSVQNTHWCTCSVQNTHWCTYSVQYTPWCTCNEH